MKKLVVFFSFLCAFQNNAKAFGGVYGEVFGGFKASTFKSERKHIYDGATVDGIDEVAKDLINGYKSKAPFFVNLGLPTSSKVKNSFVLGFGLGYDFLLKDIVVIGAFVRYGFGGSSGGTPRYAVGEVNRPQNTIGNIIPEKLSGTLKKTEGFTGGLRMGFVAGKFMPFFGWGLRSYQCKLNFPGAGLPSGRKNIIAPFFSLGCDYQFSSNFLFGVVVEKVMSRTVTFQKQPINDFYIALGRPSFKVGETRFLFSLKYCFSPSSKSPSFGE